MKSRLAVFAVVCCIGVTTSVAADPLFGSGKLLATPGVVQVEGAGGSGLSTWAVISGYGTNRELGINAHYTYASFDDFSLQSVGARIGIFDRLELSFTRQYFDTGDVGTALSLGQGFNFNQDIYGAKLRLFGDAVYDQDKWLPQVSFGAQYKKADKGVVISAIGGADDGDMDYYLAATKILLDKSLVLSATARLTRANQFGLLGFGGDKETGRTLQWEGNATYLLSKHLIFGADYRSKPDNLSFAKEEDAFALFGVWLPSKHFTVTAAYVNLGDVALQPSQDGFYISLQTGF